MVNQATGNFEHIYDGSVYQESCRQGEIPFYPTKISFTLYTDGVPIFKSSKFSIWPVYLVIHELPYEDRYTQ